MEHLDVTIRRSTCSKLVRAAASLARPLRVQSLRIAVTMKPMTPTMRETRVIMNGYEKSKPTNDQSNSDDDDNDTMIMTTTNSCHESNPPPSHRQAQQWRSDESHNTRATVEIRTTTPMKRARVPSVHTRLGDAHSLRNTESRTVELAALDRL